MTYFPRTASGSTCSPATSTAEVVNVVQRKVGRLNTPTGRIEGEKSMWAEVGE